MAEELCRIIIKHFEKKGYIVHFPYTPEIMRLLDAVEEFLPDEFMEDYFKRLHENARIHFFENLDQRVYTSNLAAIVHELKDELKDFYDWVAEDAINSCRLNNYRTQ